MLKPISNLGFIGVLHLLLLMTGPAVSTAAAEEPPVIDFFDLPDEIRTNLGTFLVTGTAEEGEVLKIGGASVALTGLDFAVPVPLRPGKNEVEVVLLSSGGHREVRKTVFFDRAFSTAGLRLVYVDSEAGALQGTIVVDLTNDTLLGYLPGQHVRGISPAGDEVYFHNRSVLSTAAHKPLRRLEFTREISVNGFLLSPDGSRFYSQNQILERRGRRRVRRQLRESILTGDSWSNAAIPGGPAISPDGNRIFYSTRLQILDTQTLARSTTGISLGLDFLSDIAVTPDGRHLLLSRYSFATGKLYVCDAESFAQVAVVSGLGDFAGEIAVSPDGSKLIIGSSGNPMSLDDGRLTVVDAQSFQTLSQIRVQLADNLAVSNEDEVLVASGNRAGLDVFRIEADGKLSLEKTFFLGIHRFTQSSGHPRWDSVRKIIYKPARP